MAETFDSRFGGPVLRLSDLLWALSGGIFIAAGYTLAGISLCLTIVGIPFGLVMFRRARIACVPFGKTVIKSPDADRPVYVIANIVWLLYCGWTIVIGHLIYAGLLKLTVVGKPFAEEHLKLIELAAFPFGRTLGFA